MWLLPCLPSLIETLKGYSNKYIEMTSGFNPMKQMPTSSTTL